MTWKKYRHLQEFGIDLVGCSGEGKNLSEPLGMRCNPHGGDTQCNTSLPILCTKQDNSPRPAISVTLNDHLGWNKGQIRLTSPVRGSVLGDSDEVDQFCQVIFGDEWRTATFHDGGSAWNYYSYGNISSHTRFWVHISDQDANCWNH